MSIYFESYESWQYKLITLYDTRKSIDEFELKHCNTILNYNQLI